MVAEEQRRWRLKRRRYLELWQRCKLEARVAQARFWDRAKRTHGAPFIGASGLELMPNVEDFGIRRWDSSSIESGRTPQS